MTYDDGLMTICRLEYPPNQGQMPKAQLQELWRHFYGARTIGYGRYYAAQGVNQQIDMLVRVWADPNIQIGMYAVLETGEQYRIDNVQHLLDDDGLKVTDLTLRKVDDLYEISAITA